MNPISTDGRTTPERLTLFARIAPKPEHYDETRRAIEEILPQTLAEPGCHVFTLHEGHGDGCLYLYEEFDDEAALQEHVRQPFAQAVFESYKTWLREPLQITKLRRIS